MAAQAAALGTMAMRCLWMSMPKGSWIDDTSLRSTAEALAQAGVSIMSNAPGDHAFPPILALRQAGVQVFSGNDNIQDAWWPFGNGYMLQRVMLVAYRSGFRSDEESCSLPWIWPPTPLQPFSLAAGGVRALGLLGYRHQGQGRGA